MPVRQREESRQDFLPDRVERERIAAERRDVDQTPMDSHETEFRQRQLESARHESDDDEAGRGQRERPARPPRQAFEQDHNRQRQQPERAFELDHRQHQRKSGAQQQLPRRPGFDEPHPRERSEPEHQRDPQIGIARERDVGIEQWQRHQRVDQRQRGERGMSGGAPVPVRGERERDQRPAPRERNARPLERVRRTREPQLDPRQEVGIGRGRRRQRRRMPAGQPFLHRYPRFGMAQPEPRLRLERPRRPRVPREQWPQRGFPREQADTDCDQRDEQSEHDPDQHVRGVGDLIDPRIPMAPGPERRHHPRHDSNQHQPRRGAREGFPRRSGRAKRREQAGQQDADQPAGAQRRRAISATRPGARGEPPNAGAGEQRKRPREDVLSAHAAPGSTAPSTTESRSCRRTRHPRGA